jgi:deoxyxylulose-5-phosphate synthase
LPDENASTPRARCRPESEAILAAFYPEGDYRGYGIRPDFKSKEEARDGVIITYGAVAEEALKAKEALQKEGVFVGILLLEILKPYDTLAEKLLPYLSDAPRLLFLEEGIYDGGAGMLLFDRLTGAGVTAPHKILAVRDHFAIPDKREDYRSFSHIAAADVVAYFSK